MDLLRKINNDDTTFVFNKILMSGYIINEQRDVLAKKKYANGTRKKIVTTYTDAVIKINLGCFDADTLREYIQHLTDGPYEYYSLNDNVYKTANFIVTLPSQTIINCASDVEVEDMTCTLEKSGDVV